MNRRLPVVVLILGSLVAALLIDRSVDDTPTVGTEAAAIDSSVFPIASPGALSSTWYCAGGTADEEAFADHVVLVLNPTDTEATVTLTTYAGVVAPPSTVVDPDDLDSSDETTTTTEAPDETTTTEAPDPEGSETERSAPEVSELIVEPQSRLRVVLSEIMDAPIASALVESTVGGIVVEHEVRSVHGRDSKPCATAAAPEWHFAWGDTTVDSRELLVLFNPFPQDAIVDGRFSTENGVREPVRFDGLVVPGRGTIGVDLGDDVTRREEVAATITTRSGRIVVDRIVRQNSDTERGLTVQLGVPSAQNAWVYPDGYRSDEVREEFVVYNPSDEVAEAEIAFVLDDPETNGIPDPIDISLAPGAHQVVDVGAEDRVPAEVGHSAIVRSVNDVPVVAERVVYSDRTNRRGVTVTTGSPVESETWTFAAGAANDDNDEFLVLVNLDNQVLSEIDIEVVAGGQRLPVAGLTGIELGPGERRVVSLDENTDSGTLPLEVRSTEPIVVERGLYRVGDDDRGMSNAVGVPGPEGLRAPIDPLDAAAPEVDVGELNDPEPDDGDVPVAPGDVELPEPDETIVIDDPDAEATDPDATTTSTTEGEIPPDEVPETTP
ncbi:DUF5719 family protein [Actinospongicola halichondriae]|uniref:DUF5719 family protein n=1 Tax=Actinospongicola halichondriae TaxID=3236844 RepID=UPI003D55D351